MREHEGGRRDRATEIAILQRKSVIGLETARNRTMIAQAFGVADRREETPGQGRPSERLGGGAGFGESVVAQYR